MDEPTVSVEKQRSTRVPKRIVLVAALLAVAAAVAIYVLPDDDPKPAQATTIVAEAAFPVSPVPRSDGSFLYAERQTGRIREVSPTGTLVNRPVAVVAIKAEPGQRGLLGLAIGSRGRTFASWTRSRDGRLVVGQVAPGRERILWLGPPSTDLANGGHLVAAPDGRLVIGIGDLQDRTKLDDPDAPNGKMLSLDPEGPADQTPTVLSSGWNNPFAFTFLPDGTLWVADNSPGRQPERIGRGDRNGLPRLDLEGRRAPSALVALGSGRLGLCGYLDREMHDVRVDGDQARQPGRALATPCSLGAAALAGGSVVVTTEDSIATVRL